MRGACRRNLLSELGKAKLNVPRIRRHCPTAASYVPHAQERMAGFVPELSARKIGEALLTRCPMSPATVSRVALDEAAEAFHRRSPTNDGSDVRRRGARPQDRRPEGRKEDYRAARAESAAERLLNDARGLTGTLLVAYHSIQRCRARKAVPRQGFQQEAAKHDLHAVASNRVRGTAKRFATLWEDAYPKAVACATISCWHVSGIETPAGEP